MFTFWFLTLDASDIVNGNLKLILGLIWTLVLKYTISPPVMDAGAETSMTPKQALLKWVQNKVPDIPIHNFSNDWNDGCAIGALVDAVAPGTYNASSRHLWPTDLYTLVTKRLLRFWWKPVAIFGVTPGVDSYSRHFESTKGVFSFFFFL